MYVNCADAGETGKYKLKVATNLKADVWKSFPLVYEIKEDGSAVAVNYFCACVVCNKVYQYKGASGKNFGTKNQIEHLKKCKGGLLKSQMTFQLCMPMKTDLSITDRATLKRKLIMYCVSDYHSFRCVENDGLVGLMQTCVDLGAKSGKFDISEAVVGRKTISREIASAADAIRTRAIERLTDPIADGTISLPIDIYTDDYRKQSYLDVHANWVERDFSCHHTALAVRHFEPSAHTAKQIQIAICNILSEYGISLQDTMFTTDHGSDVEAALETSVRLDCLCHRLHTVLESAWRETREENAEAAAYEVAISELCRFVEYSAGIQEQLPKSLKHGGDTRPLVSMYRRAEAVECSYEALVNVLKIENRLELIAAVSRSLNREIFELTGVIARVCESLEAVNEPTLNLVGPSYYLLMKKFAPAVRDSAVVQIFRMYRRKFMDEKFWTSVVALHWMASFLDPSFKDLEFIPQGSAADIEFRQNLQFDLDRWMMSELNIVIQKLKLLSTPASILSGFVLVSFIYLFLIIIIFVQKVQHSNEKEIIFASN